MHVLIRYTLMVVVCLVFPVALASAEQPVTALDGPWWLARAGVPDPLVICMAAPLKVQTGKQALLTLQLHGAGIGTDAPAAESWHVTDIKVDGHAATGRIALVGASFLSVGDFFLALDDAGTLDGRITDETGTEVAAVAGTVTPTGAEGRFDAYNGESGTWSWNAPSAAQFQTMRQTLVEAAQE